MSKTIFKSNSSSGNIIFILIGTLTFIGGIILAVLSTQSRFQAAADSVYYERTQGRIVKTYSYEHEDSDDNIYYTYSAEVSYDADNQTYRIETDDFYDSKPTRGKYVDVMYRIENPSDSYVAEKDWLTKKYIPMGKDSDMKLFASIFLCSFGVIAYGMLCVSKINAKAGYGMLGGGIFLIGVTGVAAGIITKNYPMLILIVFALAGGLVLYQTFVGPVGRESKENLRLVIVKQIFSDTDGFPNTVLFALVGNNGIEWYYSYKSELTDKFAVGNKYSLDVAQIDMTAPTVSLGAYTATDISYLPQDAFRPLNKVLKILFSSIHV